MFPISVNWHTWRAHPTAILPLVFLQCFTLDMLEAPITRLLIGAVCGSRAVEREFCIERINQDTTFTVYYVILTVATILVASQYGRISDKRGRKRAIGIALSVNVLADLWLLLAALVPSFATSPVLIFAALLKGLGGGHRALLATSLAFVAETSSTATRSLYFGLLLAVTALSSYTGMRSSSFSVRGSTTSFFGIAIVSWAICALYLAFVLRETQGAHIIPGQNGDDSSRAEKTNHTTPHKTHSGRSRTSRSLVHSLIDPLALVLSQPTLFLLGAVGSFTHSNIGALIYYYTHEFKLSTSEYYNITHLYMISFSVPLVSLLCIFPILIGIYRTFFAPKVFVASTTEGTSNKDYNSDGQPVPSMLYKRSSLLVDYDEHADESSTGTQTLSQDLSRQTSAAQELMICRTFFAISLIGTILISVSRNTSEIYISSAISALGVPIGPSISALMSMVVPSNRLGRLYAGVAMIEALGAAIRRSLLLGLFEHSIDKFPCLIWYATGILLLLCLVILASLRSTRFVRSPTAAITD